ncbi:IclR family transcriptional regulator [Bordetella genomosp. 10]|uniref:IclR family transcriptional regulator n=1 Tax=Bordetella genomosp. 10 TaxID=1416804 RepID=A0A261SBT4_9BORD|nr:helix-turn-helix domain-containing protein [Bordetella genomosp. 10]OZI34859.1 IclR family transcriptional regulator [Bordetella genomosp. 10]
MSRSAPQDNTDGVAAVERALSIVDAIAQRTEPIGLADLSRATGFYKSTLLRLIASLEKANLVVRRADGRYALGLYAHQLGRAYEATYRLAETLQPLLQGLVDQGTESASFHAYHDPRSRICLLRVDSHHSTLDRIRPGDLLPLDKGAAGKLLTAYLVRGESVETAGLILTSMGERDPSCAAVASPVFGPDDEMRGAISLSGPKERYTPASIKKMSRLLLESAARATRALGGRWPG